jgi:hypothetical protein
VQSHQATLCVQGRLDATAPVRCGMLLAITAIAFTGRHYLGVAESIAGAVCALQCSLLLPTVFHMALSAKRGRLPWWLGAALGAMLVFGVGLLVMIVIEAVGDALHRQPHAAAHGSAGLAAFRWGRMATARDWT